MAIDISSTSRRVVYTGSAGVGPYAFNFEVLAQTDIAVYFNDTELTLTTDYTVTVDADGTGSVTLVVAATSSDRITIVGDRTIQRTSDFTTGGPLFAETLNDEFDSLTIFAQQNLEQSNRSLRAPNTDPTNIDMVLPINTVRANKTLAFDANGNPVIGEQIGDYKGDWAAGTAYNKRDLVKDTTNDNIYLCVTAHTSSGVLPLDTNVDYTKWDLIVDAAAAAASASAAATSATNAANSATAAATSETNASTSETNAANSATASATSATNSANSATASANSATAAAASEAAAAAYTDNFDDTYLGAKASDPTLDNDGDALADGALYFDTTNNVMKVYDLGTTTWYQLTPTVSNQTNINTVAGIASDVSAVAAIDTNVTTVAGITSDVTAVAADATDIGTVATNIANVNTTATNIANVNTTATNITNVNTVGSISSDVTSVAGISGNVTTVAGNSSNVTTVAGISGNVTTVAGISSDVTTAATNVADITNFADVYYGPSASAPSTRQDGGALQTGDLYFNTTANQLYIWDGSAWNDAALDVTGAVTSFNTRTGAVTLSASDVNTALGSDAVLDSDIGVTVQAYDADTAKYDDVTANFTGTLQNGGSNVVVDTDIDSTVIGYVAPGTSGNVLTSNGTTWTSAAAAAFDSGTRMLFAQNTAPTGWTKDTTNYNNHALRVTTGTASTGGTVDFTSAFVSQAVSVSGTTDNTTAGGTVASHTLATSSIPAHAHSINGPWDGTSSKSGPTSYFQEGLRTSPPATKNTNNTGGGGSHNHGFTGTAHNHTFTGSDTIDLAVKYLDVITATKD